MQVTPFAPPAYDARYPGEPAKLSIIVPAYNLERYIEQCVRAVLGQLREHHELIVIDDGSTDSTHALVLKLQQAWPGTNFHVLSHANEGIAGTRNHGLRAARGEYIVWIDGDDVLREGMLGMLDQAIDLHRPDVIACDFNMWHPQEPAKTHQVAFSYAKNVLLRDTDDFLSRFLASRKNYIWATIIRRAIYTQLPDPIFPPGRVFEDVSTLPRLFSHCASLLYLPVPIIDYRQHPASITQVVSEKSSMDFAAAVPVARRHLQARGVSDAVKRHFDITAGHFYLEAIKSSYYLPRAEGKRVRDAITPSFVDNLFGDCDTMLETTKRADTISQNRKKDLRMIKQVRMALAGDIFFHGAQSVVRMYKMWRRARKLQRYSAALASARNTAKQ